MVTAMGMGGIDTSPPWEQTTSSDNWPTTYFIKFSSNHRSSTRLSIHGEWDACPLRKPAEGYLQCPAALKTAWAAVAADTAHAVRGWVKVKPKLPKMALA